MNFNRKAFRVTACCMAAALVLTGTSVQTYAASPVAGVSGIMASALKDVAKSSIITPTAGISSMVADCVTTAAVADVPVIAKAEIIEPITDTEVTVIEGEIEETAKKNKKDKKNKKNKKKEEKKSEYADIAIAQVDNYVNVRDAATEEGNVVGKLYNNSAATVHGTEGDWYQITSGNVTGYVKSEFVVCGDEELAKKVSRRVATVQTETLFVRMEPTTESDVVGMVPDQDDLTVIDESVEGWTKVTLEGGDGYVSNDYITLSTEFVTAESKAEEEARLAKEEAERKAAAAAAAKKTANNVISDSGSASSRGSAVANYACQFVGNPYVYGGTSLTNGADCSGFIMAVYAAFGVGLPHSSAAMRGVGYGVSTSELQPGDIICYSGHVALYIGNNTIVHASTPATGIKYTSPINYKPILAVRRIF